MLCRLVALLLFVITSYLVILYILNLFFVSSYIYIILYVLSYVEILADKNSVSFSLRRTTRCVTLARLLLALCLAWEVA